MLDTNLADYKKCSQLNSLNLTKEGRERDRLTQNIMYPGPVSYTHLDVYKRQQSSVDVIV